MASNASSCRDDVSKPFRRTSARACVLGPTPIAARRSSNRDAAAQKDACRRNYARRAPLYLGDLGVLAGQDRGFEDRDEGRLARQAARARPVYVPRYGRGNQMLQEA